MRIVAVSFGAPEVTKAWVDDQSFPYEVWTDTDKTLARTFGAIDDPSAERPSRITVVLDAEGRVALEYRDIGLGLPGHPQDVLDDVRALFGPR